MRAFGPRREKICLRGVGQSEFQTTLLSYRDKLENSDFTRSKFTNDNFQKANNKGADQTARMRRLVCACVVRKPPKTGFLASRPIYGRVVWLRERMNGHELKMSVTTMQDLIKIRNGS